MAKIGFVTCVQLGLSCMEAIYDAGAGLALAITLNDTQAQGKSGRIYLDGFCSRHSIPLFKSSHINNKDVINRIRDAELDWLFIVGWSQVASKELISTPKNGSLGMHPTLLPIGRGRASVPWSILKGLNKTGVTLFKLDEGVDTGAIVDQVEIPLNSEINATKLYNEVNDAHIALIHKTIPMIKEGNVQLTIQNDSLATEWPGRRPEDGELDMNGSVYDAEKLVRALTYPYPGAFFVKDHKKFIVHKSRIMINKPSVEYLSFHDGFLALIDVEICR